MGGQSCVPISQYFQGPVGIHTNAFLLNKSTWSRECGSLVWTVTMDMAAYRDVII
jgi:hypothetical protein